MRSWSNPSTLNGTTPTLFAPSSVCGPWIVQTGDLGEARERVPSELAFVGRDALPAEVLEDERGRRERDRAEHVRRTRFAAIREVGPRDVVGRDGQHGPAADVVGRRRERVPATDQRARAERCVHLVRGERDEVEVLRIVVWAHVDGTVAGELGGVDGDVSADRVHLLGEGVDRRHDTGDVRRARHGEQRDATGMLREQFVEVLFVERTVRQRAHD